MSREGTKKESEGREGGGANEKKWDFLVNLLGSLFGRRGNRQSCEGSVRSQSIAEKQDHGWGRKRWGLENWVQSVIFKRISSRLRNDKRKFGRGHWLQGKADFMNWRPKKTTIL